MGNLLGKDFAVTFFDGKKEQLGASSKKQCKYWTTLVTEGQPEENIVRVLPGRNTSQYELEQIQLGKMIGEGAQAKIFKANLCMKADPKSETYTVVVKEVAAKVFKHNLFHYRFGQWPEELFASHGGCDHICEFLGYTGDEKSFCLLMAKYDCSLRGCIDKQMKKWICWGRPFRGPTAMSIIIKIAIGMSYLHLLNVPHRDLKADNILVMNLSEDDDFPAGIFIGDFELSPWAVGTRFWRATEILQGLRDNIPSPDIPFTSKSDVYSFAMTCYEILTGLIPFDGIMASNYDVVLSGARPALPSTLNPRMRELLTKCWHHDPDARPTFVEIVSELKDFVAGTEALMALFDDSTFETWRVNRASVESNIVEFKERVKDLAAKYKEEDFVAWAGQFADAVEEFRLQFGCRSYGEQPSLPPAKNMQRMVLIDRIDFSLKMFWKTCPDILPEFRLLSRLMVAIFYNKMQDGSFPGAALKVEDSDVMEEYTRFQSIMDAWEVEKQQRTETSALVNRHEVCYGILRSKRDVGPNGEHACEVCKNLPLFAPKSKVCTFHVFSDWGTSSRTVSRMLWYVVKKLLFCR